MDGPALLAALLAAAAVAVLLSPADDVRLRAAVPRAGERADRRGPPARARDAAATRQDRAPRAAQGTARTADTGPAAGGARPQAACLLAGGALAVVVTAPVGPVLGALVAVAGPRLLERMEPRAAREHREQLARDLPLALELLAATLAGGATLPAAGEAVGQALGGPVGGRLGSVAAVLAVGGSAAEAWASLAGSDPARRAEDPLGPAARALARSAEGGAPVALAVSRLAAQARVEQRSTAEQAARRVGVLAVAPLGLCFLPAFVLLGVVPVVVSLAGPLLDGL